MVSIDRVHEVVLSLRTGIKRMLFQDAPDLPAAKINISAGEGNDKGLYIRLSQSDKKRLEYVSKCTGKTQSRIIRECIEERFLRCGIQGELFIEEKNCDKR